MSDETQDAATQGGITLTEQPSPPSTEDAATPAGEEKPKKKIRRKPIWVCIPVDFEEVDHLDEVAERPTAYAIKRCQKYKEIRAFLAKHEVDIRKIDQVLMFRANPMAWEADVQYNFRFKEAK